MENLFKNVKPKSKALYIANIKRLNGGKDVDIDNLDFLENVDKVSEYLSSKYAQTTIRSYFIAICSLLSELPKYKTLYDKYYPILISQNKSLATNNTKSEKQEEHWMSQDDVLETQQKVQNQAIDIINASPDNKFRPKAWMNVLDWVIISIFTLIPPRRILDYCEMSIVETLPEEDEDDAGDKNYWVKSTNKFVFKNYKTSHTYKTQIVKIPEKLGQVLQVYLDLRSDKNENNIPFLIDGNGKAIRENYNITKYLNNIFGKKVSVNMLRNIYLTDTFKDNLINLKSTARMMGTSEETIQNHYVKLDAPIELPPTPLPTPKLSIPISEPQKPVEAPKKKRGRPPKKQVI
jgi:hypothetical protein